MPQNAVKKLSSSKTSYGSLTARFSPNGNFLAFHCFSAVLDEHDILVMDVTTSKIISTLRGHLSIIYDIDWFNEHTLVSVSSDRTAIVWSINHDEYTMTVSVSIIVFFGVNLDRLFCSHCILLDSSTSFLCLCGSSLIYIYKIHLHCDWW